VVGEKFPGAEASRVARGGKTGGKKKGRCWLAIGDLLRQRGTDFRWCGGGQKVKRGRWR